MPAKLSFKKNVNLKRSLGKNYKSKVGTSLAEKPQPLTHKFFETFKAFLNNVANDEKK